MLNKIWKVLPYIILAALIGLMVFSCLNGGDHKLKLNIALEDGMLEWGTVGMFGVCGILALFAGLLNRKILSKKQLVCILLFAALCFIAVGEELDWGKRIIGFDVPKGMESHSDSKIKWGHDSTSLHNLKVDLGWFKWSLSGMFGIPLVVVLGFHGIILPIQVRRKERIALKIVEKTGIFLPPLDLGILATAAALFFYIIRKSPWNDFTEPNEFKEFIIPIIYSSMIVCVFFKESKAAKTAVKIIMLLVMLGLIALSTQALYHF